jgi:D-glycero-alpha-D-manno-heptose 1-phosphate guanylyltransferase
MAPVSERPFLGHLMDYWINQGIDEFIISVGYKKEIIIDFFGSNYKSIPLKYVMENEPLGTGGGLLKAARGLNDPIIILNGDTFFEVSLKELQEFHEEHSSEWTFSLFRANEVGRYMGVEVKSNGEIESFKSDTGKIGRLANGGVYLINPNVLVKTEFAQDIKLSLEDDIIPALVANDVKIYGKEFSEKFIDIGVPQDYFRAADILPN